MTLPNNPNKTFTLELTQYEIQALNDSIVTTWNEGKVTSPVFASALITTQAKFEAIAKAVQAAQAAQVNQATAPGNGNGDPEPVPVDIAETNRI